MMNREEQIINAAKTFEKKEGFSPIVMKAKGVNSAAGIGFLEGAVWADNHPRQLWKDAQGDDLPEMEREVVVFTQDIPNDDGLMLVGIAHRPNPKGWDGISISTTKVEHYTPKTYDNGGWNIPNVKYWLDLDLPMKGE